MTYSLDFRKHALGIRDQEKLSLKAVAERFGVSCQTVYRWTKRLESKTTRNKGATKIDMEALKQDIVKIPDAYHYERAARLGVSPRGIGYALKRLGVTYKKNTFSSEGLPRRTTCLPGQAQRL
jgi:transposase